MAGYRSVGAIWHSPGRRWWPVLGLSSWTGWGRHKLNGVSQEGKGASEEVLFWGEASFVGPAGNAATDPVKGPGPFPEPGDTGEGRVVHCQCLEPCVTVIEGTEVEGFMDELVKCVIQTLRGPR